MDPDRTTTRRGVLAALGAAGVVTAGAGALGRDRTPPFTRYSYAATPDGDTDDGRLRVAWYESYRGTVQERQNGTAGGNGAAPNASRTLDPAADPQYVAEANGPVIALHDVVPGDTGRLLVGLQTATGDDAGGSGAESGGTAGETTEGVAVWLHADIAQSENGVIEPEANAPGEGPGGELGEAVQTTFWLDDGLLGSCDGTLGVDESPFVDDTLAGSAAALADGRRLVDCLAPGDRRCVGIAWELPETVGDSVQTDRVTFDLVFAGVPCGSENPFGDGAG